MGSMKTVHVARNPLEAELMVGFLQAHGVEAWAEGQDLWAVRGEVAMDAASAPRVVVRDGDHERASALLGQHLPGGACNR